MHCLAQAEHLVFIDETHKASKDWYPQYGYSRSGCPARVEMVGPINLSFSTLAAMTLDGMIGWKTTPQIHAFGQASRGQDTGCFLENFCAVVLPYLRPFPEPCSVIILDNSRCVSTLRAVCSATAVIAPPLTDSSACAAACTTTTRPRLRPSSPWSVRGCTTCRRTRRS